MRLKQNTERVKNKITANNKEGRPAVFDSIVFYAVFSVFLEFLIEIMSRHSFTAALKFAFFGFYAFLFNSLLIFVCYCLAFFIPKREFYFTLVTAVWAGLGITNCIMLYNRVTPFTPVDLTLVPSVFHIFSVYLNAFEIVGICLLTAAAIALIVFTAVKFKSYKVLWKKGLISLAVTGAVIALVYNFGLFSTALSKDFYNLNTAYSDYGFPYCFTCGIFDNGIKKPSEYSDGAVTDILERIDAGDTNVPAEKPNIIFVQLESFFDPKNMKDYEFSENPVPFFDKIRAEGISGYLTVPVVGSGTINTEFEVLTGMDLSCFGAGQYPYKTVLSDTTCETVAYDLIELGYSTHAIHNYRGTFYDRDKVYPNMGFHTFTSLELMNGVEYNPGGWPDDSVLTGEIIDAMRSTDKPDFVMAVSVQGHGKYPPGDLPKDYVCSVEVTAAEGAEKSAEELAAVSYYVDQIRGMDDFIRELVSAINEFEEKCVLVFYGDHLPSLSLTDEELESGSIFKTEYAIVSNFGLENGVSGEDLHSYQLSSRTLGYLGINNGIMTKLHQKCSGDDDYTDIMKELEYDMLYGARYSYGGKKKYYPVIMMRMGIREIKVNSCTVDGSVLTIMGENFTPYSDIVINGKIYKNTVFIDENTLEVRYANAPEDVSVVQLSDTEDVLCKSNTLTMYTDDAELR